MRIAPQKRLPSPVSRRSRWRNGIFPFSTLSPSRESTAGSTVSEPIMATPTTIIVPIAERHERRLAGEEHPGHRDHDREAGDEHCPARGRSGGLESSALAPSGLALVSFTTQVEERVVDADCEPDQQDDLLNLSVHRDELAHDRDEPHGREDRRQPDQDRHERGHERPEHEQQDEDRQWKRDHACLGDPAVDQLLERLLGRDTCLAHVEARVRLLHAGCGGGDRVDVFRRLVVVPARLERDQDRVPVGRDLALVAGGAAARAASRPSGSP